MICGQFHEGSGLGDQIFRYITVRTLAEKKGFDFGMIGSFKGSEFLNNVKGDDFDSKLHMEAEFAPNEIHKWIEKDVRDQNGVDIRSYDPEINFVEDNTIIDGSFEDDKYFRHNLKNINEWLKVEPVDVPDDMCLIGFRGGEYASIPDLFLDKAYYEEGILKMLTKGVSKFQVHTDDPTLAKKYFPDFEIVENTPISHSRHSNMGFNWRSMRYAKYAIIPNSAFFILPRILRHFEDSTAITYAPRYWARRNTKTWARPACYYPEFSYL